MIRRSRWIGLGMLLFLGCGAPAEEKAAWEGGKPFPAKEPVPLSRLEAGGASYKDREVRIEGKISRVCQGRGCWVELSGGGSRMIAKSLDHSVLFPKDCVGKRAIVDGTVRVNPPPACKDDHKGKADHECPRPSVLVEIRGARVY